MALGTFTKLTNGEGEISGLRVNCQSVPLGVYATGGFVISPPRVAMGQIHGVIPIGFDTDAQGYVIQWNFQTGKLMVFQSAGFTPAGTISGNVVVKGGGIGEAIGINPDSVAGVLSKAAATDRTIPYATFLGGALTIAGTAVAKAALVEVSNGVDLSALTAHLMFIGC